MEDLMKIFVDELNDNTLGLIYDGNFIFQFHDEKLTVLQQVPGKLVFTEEEYSPVGMPVKECTPYSENNGRKDWLIEYNILARIHGSVYDSTVDLDYDNINGKVAAFNGLTMTYNSKRYAFKSRPAQERGYSTFGNSKYILLAVVMNVTELTVGYFGQDSSIGIRCGAVVYTPDVIEFGKVATKRYYTADKKSTATNDYNTPTGRSMSFSLKINYNNESILLTEVNGKAALDTKYTLAEIFATVTTTWTVTCEQASEIESINGVKKLAFIFKECL